MKLGTLRALTDDLTDDVEVSVSPIAHPTPLRAVYMDPGNGVLTLIPRGSEDSKPSPGKSLIAAAPDLLDVCETVLSWAGRANTDDYDWLHAMRTAVAKAKSQ